MSGRYYIQTEEGKDGPHDLVTIMRRIRAGKISYHTLVYPEGHQSPTPAGNVPEIFPFFDKDHVEAAAKGFTGKVVTMGSLLGNGWRFTHDHNIMTVFAGMILLLAIMLGIGLVGGLGIIGGSLVTWSLFWISHHLYMVFVLRLVRGQPIGPHFLDHQLTPVLGALFLASLVSSFSIAAGFLLAIIPGIIIAAMFIFVPFVALDHQGSFISMLKHSKAMLKKNDGRYARSLYKITALHLLCIAAIVPIPITLPLFGAALAELYEAMSAS